MTAAREIEIALSGHLLEVGFDITHAFDAALYNSRISEHATLQPLPLFARHGALGILVANTRHLWPLFLRSYSERPELQAADDPLDSYVVDCIERCLQTIPNRKEVRFSHERGHGLVSMLQLSEASGFANVGPAHLAVHTEYGPWFAMRAVIVVDAPAPGASPTAPDPCRECSAPCREALSHATAGHATTAEQDLRSSWRQWLAVRDACPLGQGHRYSDDQNRYHYTKDRGVLDAAHTKARRK